eukprot:TRINITY_DN2765_c0_g1_i1.p1 TRINITY_DN2765_c0_g1~~TRINITY_DN2765_c0_g1_i1.p1  ORF type:complete len:451 (+),score=99.88 TRINITY_DN2765_c0_g1_i1:108-1460(+)
MSQTDTNKLPEEEENLIKSMNNQLTLSDEEEEDISRHSYDNDRYYDDDTDSETPKNARRYDYNDTTDEGTPINARRYDYSDTDEETPRSTRRYDDSSQDITPINPRRNHDYDGSSPSYSDEDNVADLSKHSSKNGSENEYENLEQGNPELDPDVDGQEGDDEDDIEIYEGFEENFEMGKEIGSGGYSVVYEARDLQTNDRVAVKSIDISIFESDTGDAVVDPLRPLKSEIRTMQKINHPNIIKLLKVFLDEDKFYIIMELMPECEELFQRVERLGSYEEEQACFVFQQLVAAVEYLHTVLGVAHRDLKPENILMCGSGVNERLKLADFGFAKHFKEEQMKTALGSPGYAAPELFTDDTYNEKVDMWSLGVILYLMLSGNPPFYGNTIKELTDRIINCEYDFDDPCFDYVSDEARDVVSSLLVKDPMQRSSAKDLLECDWFQGFELKNLQQ